MTKSRVDPSGLGRWSWYLLEGDKGYQTRVVTAYAPCGSTAINSETYCQQQARYITEEALRTNTKELFRKDLLTQLRKWRTKGNRIIPMMDANGDVIDGALCKQLHKADLSMNEVVFSQTRRKGPKTYFRGSVAIDSIWVTEDLEVTATTNLPFDPELGEDHPVVVNTTKTPVLGVSGPRTKLTAARRLTSKVKRI